MCDTEVNIKFMTAMNLNYMHKFPYCVLPFCITEVVYVIAISSNIHFLLPVDSTGIPSCSNAGTVTQMKDPPSQPF